jgi:hypothetical protein
VNGRRVRLRQCILILWTVGVSVGVLAAHSGENEIACFQSRKENRAFKKKLWEGYEISLGPSSNPEAVEDACTAAIYNHAGKVVFRTSGFSVIFDERETGQDFDGDGKPEVVFRTDIGGGNHCCWTFNVVTLSPRPHRLFDLPPSSFKKDAQGKMLIWERLPGTASYTSMANQPFAERVFRVVDGKLVDVTPEFCPSILSPESEDFKEQSRLLTPDAIKRLQADTSSAEMDEVVSAVLSRALQHVFCRQYDEAVKDLNLWPEATRAKMENDFAQSIEQDFPEFAKRLRGPNSK